MDVAKIRAVLTDANPYVHRSGMHSLQEAVTNGERGPEVLELLRVALADLDPLLVYEALHTVKMLGTAGSPLADPVFALAQRIEPLRTTSDHAEVWTCLPGGEPQWHPLCAIKTPTANFGFDKGEQHHETRCASCVVAMDRLLELGALVPTRRQVEFVAEAVTVLTQIAPGPRLQLLCLQYLDSLGARASSEDAVACLQGLQVREASPGDLPPEHVAEVVVRHLRAGGVYTAGLRVLASLGPIASLEVRKEVLRFCRESSMPEVQALATETALRVLRHDDELAEVVLRAVADLLGRGYLSGVVDALPRLQHSGAGVRALFSTLVSTELVQRAVTALVVAQVEPTEIEAHLARQLADVQATVRLAAVAGLQQLAATLPSAILAAVAVASDSDKNVRLAVATALSAALSQFPQVKPALEKLSRDRSKFVRAPAKQALG